MPSNRDMQSLPLPVISNVNALYQYTPRVWMGTRIADDGNINDVYYRIYCWAVAIVPRPTSWVFIVKPAICISVLSCRVTSMSYVSRSWSADRRWIYIYVHEKNLYTVSSTPEWSNLVRDWRTHTQTNDGFIHTCTWEEFVYSIQGVARKQYSSTLSFQYFTCTQCI